VILGPTTYKRLFQKALIVTIRTEGEPNGRKTADDYSGTAQDDRDEGAYAFWIPQMIDRLYESAEVHEHGNAAADHQVDRNETLDRALLQIHGSYSTSVEKTQYSMCSKFMRDRCEEGAAVLVRPCECKTYIIHCCAVLRSGSVNISVFIYQPIGRTCIYTKIHKLQNKHGVKNLQ